MPDQPLLLEEGEDFPGLTGNMVSSYVRGAKRGNSNDYRGKAAEKGKQINQTHSLALLAALSAPLSWSDTKSHSKTQGTYPGF